MPFDWKQSEQSGSKAYNLYVIIIKIMNGGVFTVPNETEINNQYMNFMLFEPWNEEICKEDPSYTVFWQTFIFETFFSQLHELWL